MSQQNGLSPIPPQNPTDLRKVRSQTPFPFRTALSLHRENATLHEKTANVEETRPKCDVPKEEGHDARNV